MHRLELACKMEKAGEDEEAGPSAARCDAVGASDMYLCVIMARVS